MGVEGGGGVELGGHRMSGMVRVTPGFINQREESTKGSSRRCAVIFK